MLMMKSYLVEIAFTHGIILELGRFDMKKNEDKLIPTGPKVVELTLDHSDKEVEEDEFEPHLSDEEEEAEEENNLSFR